MKISARFMLLIFATLVICHISSAQTRLDVSLEGPWLLYVEPQFQTAGGASPVLVAIAPNVAGHNPPVFSTGDGTVIQSLGTYCLGFDDKCTTNSTTGLSSDGYGGVQPVVVSKPAGWNWRTYGSSAYVIILPVPDSYSNDGTYPMTFQDAFPTASSTPTSTPVAVHSIGAVLHYASGPHTVSLLGCTGIPTASSCNTPAMADQNNSGTLRLNIKSVDTTPDLTGCDYHVHLAYHRMLQLVDPTFASNRAIRYMDVPTYSSCTPCDPQQDSVSPDCAAGTMSLTMAYGENLPDIPSDLTSLVQFLSQIKLNNEQRKKILVDLPTLESELRQKLPLQSQLRQLAMSLSNSDTAIDDLLANLSSDASKKKEDRLSLQVAKTLETTLINSAQRMEKLLRGGKDCRAAIMLIQ
jgi:hypothetical protein